MNKLLLGNCLDKLKEIKENSVDLVVTSPPYDDLRNYNTGKYKGNNYKEIIKELYRILKVGGGGCLDCC